jgi:hypothetical protein
MAKDTRTILDGRSSLRYRGIRYTPGMEDQLQAALSPSEMKRLQDSSMLVGDGWEAGAKESSGEVRPTLSSQDARRQMTASRAAPVGGSQMPYADLLMPVPFVSEDAVRSATDAEILAIQGIGPTRLAEIREYLAS